MERSVSLALLVAGSVSAAAQAQVSPEPPAAQPASGAGEDIIVTARRVGERAQDVPIAITAISPMQIERQQIRTLTDIQKLSPSLSITPLNGSSSSASVQIRGQVQTTAGIGVDPSTGVYINEQYLARPAGLDAAVFDVASVQVLKGPQGTLFGRSSVGGALLVETKRPGKDFGGYVSAAIETPYGYTLEGALNLPVSENIGVRLSGLRQYVEGYTKVLNGDYRLDDRDRYALRGTVQMEFGSFKNVFVADYFHSSANGPAFFPVTFNPLLVSSTSVVGAQYRAAIAEQATLDWHEKNSQFKPFSRAHTGGVNNITTFEVSPEITLKNIIGARWQYANDTVDHDGTVAPVLSTKVESDTRQFSEEFQVQAKPIDSLSIIAGGYYFWEKGHDFSNSYVNRPETATARTQNRFEAKNENVSAFTQANYTLPTSFPAHVFAGIRYNKDKRNIIFENRSVNADGSFTCIVGGAGADCHKPASKSFPATTWTAGFDVRPVEPVLLYGTVGRGYRSGGFNGRATSLAQQVPFEPEFATSYEIGAKTNWSLGGNVRAMLNVAAYTMDYTNIQRALVVISAGAPVSIVINTPSARIRGVELEGNLRFGSDITLSGFFGYTDPKYKKYIDNGVDRSDNKFTFVPKIQSGATLDWTVLRSQQGDFAFNLNYAHRSALQLEVVNFPGSVVAGYDLVNASVRWDKIVGTRLSTEVYAQNLFDKDYEVGGFGAAGSVGVANVIHGAPRVVGLRVRLPFGEE
jgi:iron complex outermembrane receptor protein